MLTPQKRVLSSAVCSHLQRQGSTSQALRGPHETCMIVLIHASVTTTEQTIGALKDAAHHWDTLPVMFASMRGALVLMPTLTK